MVLQQISFTQSHFVPTGNITIFWLDSVLATIMGLNQVQVYCGFHQNPSKTILPPGKPEGNTVHRIHYAVSPEIVLMGGCSTEVLVAWE
jgi:hypothetical protein